jgi:tetratricopeptide (TPR) repeat protein
MLTTLILPLLLQVGPNPALAPAPAVPEELIEQRRIKRERQRPPVAVVEADPVQACAALAAAAPDAALEEAQARFDRAIGLDRAIAGHCLGLAYSELGQWPQAADAFGRARDALPAEQASYAVRLGIATAAAELAAGRAEAALGELARTDPGQDRKLAGAIAVDRSRALVALGRQGEAATALAEARAADPDNDEAWLLSATLSRRTGDLVTAQQQIERAAILRPTGPEIGLEAGVIAALAGRDEAALRSWRSVLESAPGTPTALTAAAYIAQLQEQ